MQAIARHPALLHKGEHLMRAGDRFADLYAVRSGSFKAYTTDVQGREHVLGFFMPGELIGFDGIQTGQYRVNVVVLQTSSLCAISYLALIRLFAVIPTLSADMMRILSQKLSVNGTLAGDYTAEERSAAFLTGMSDRFSGRGYSPKTFILPMSRCDIANYLRLAPETVSRVLARFVKHGLIQVSSREIRILDRDGLDQIAGCMGPLGS
jgi:CRP/FNR family transcriptional regulator